MRECGVGGVRVGEVGSERECDSGEVERESWECESGE